MMDSIELFSGTGGLALGLQMSGFNHTALYEWDKDSCDNLNYNIQNGYPAIKDWKVFGFGSVLFGTSIRRCVPDHAVFSEIRQ